MPDQLRLHEHHFRYAVNRELTELYASVTIQNFAAGLLLIFEPIYVYRMFGQSLPHTFFFFGLGYLLTAFFTPLAQRALIRLGVKHSMLAAMPFVLLYYWGLWNYESLDALVMLLPFFSAAFTVLYWPAFHTDFTMFSRKGFRSRQNSYAIILVSLAAAAAPFLGGFIITTSGFPLLFTLALALYLASMVPLFLSKDMHERIREPYLRSVKEVWEPIHRSKAVAFMGEGLDSAVLRLVWPLFLFLLAVNFEELGAISSSALLVGIIFTFYIGRLADRPDAHRLVRVGSVADALLWPVRAFAVTPFTAFLVHIAHGFGRSMVFIPFASMFYNWAGDDDKFRARHIFIRSIALNGAAGIGLMLLAVATIFTSHLAFVFFIAPLFALALMFIIKNPLARFGVRLVPQKRTGTR